MSVYVYIINIYTLLQLSQLIPGYKDLKYETMDFSRFSVILLRVGAFEIYWKIIF